MEKQENSGATLKEDVASNYTFENVLDTIINSLDTNTAEKVFAKFKTSKPSMRELQVIIPDEIIEISKRVKHRIIMINGQYHVFIKTHWVVIDLEHIRSFIELATLKMGFNSYSLRHHNFLENVVKQFQSKVDKVISKPKSNFTKINCLNGTLKLYKDGPKLEPHNELDYITHVIKVVYEPNAPQPVKFKKFLNKVLPEICAQEVLGEAIAYPLINYFNIEKSIVLLGSGANGKSVVHKITYGIYGSENICSFSVQALGDNTGYYRAEAAGKLLNYVSEFNPHNIDNSKLKMIISGEPIEARRLYQSPFIVYDMPKIMFNTNELPTNIEYNNGFFRRFIIIPFKVTIPESEQDKTLANQIIEEELSGVLNWVLEGLDRLMKKQEFTQCDLINETLAEFKTQQDPVSLYLEDIEAKIVDHNEHNISLKNLYSNFSDYCKRFGYKQLSLVAFSKRIQQIGYNVIRRSEGRFVGLYSPTINNSNK